MALEPITRQEKIIAGQDLKPITRMEKFLKEFGGGGGGAQPDWAANEGEPGHILNRPFYESTEVMFDQRVEFQDANGMIMNSTEFPEMFEVGKTYTVTYNGTVYKCVAINPTSEGVGYIGNASAFGGEDTGEPFVMAAINNAVKGYIELVSMPLNGDTSATIRIEKTVIHTIDPKFIPAGVGGGVVIVQDSAMASGVMPAGQAAPTATMNAAQIAEAVLSGKNVYFIEPNTQTLLPFVCGYRFGEMASGVMTAVSLPDPFALFGSVDEEGWYVGVKVFLDGSYNTFDYGIKTE